MLPFVSTQDSINGVNYYFLQVFTEKNWINFLTLEIIFIMLPTLRKILLKNCILNTYYTFKIHKNSLFILSTVKSAINMILVTPEMKKLNC